MTEYFLEGKFEKVELHHIRMGFSNEIEQVGRAGFAKAVHLLRLVIRIVRARIHLRPDVLYYPPAGPNMVPFLRDCVLLIATRWMFPEIAFHFHAAGLPTLYERLPGLLKIFFRLAYFRPAVAITISEDGIRDARFLHAKRIALVPNGVPDVYPGLHSVEPEKPSILFLGMVCEEKGVGVLIDACLLLKERGVDFHCVIAGKAASNEELARLKSRAKSAEGLIDFVGPVVGDEKWKLFSSCQVFCFPTFYASESFGLVTVEAMMFGLPVVASDWRALPEIVKEGETGFLTPVRDAKATADRLEKLLTDADLRQRLGKAGRQRYLEHYRVDVFQSGMEDALS